MSTWILLLRGINVGKSRSLPMKDLARILSGMGLKHVKTYIQSGNVVFRGDVADRNALTDRLAEAIEAKFGFRPKCMVIRSDALQRAIDANPFGEAEAHPATVHLFFLSRTAESPNTEGMEAVKAESERFHLDGEVCYLHTPDGFGRSKLAGLVEKLLGVPATARNWRTVTKLRELASEIEAPQ